MRTKNNLGHAVVVLPAGLAGRISDRGLRRWLSKGRLQTVEPDDEILHRVLACIGLARSDDGLAALRFWGQTGARSTVWLAALEPVHLEARLEDLCLHTLRGGQLSVADLRSIVEHLQASLGSEQYEFVLIDNCAYLRGDKPLASSPVSARVVDGLPPADRMPKGGKGSAAESHHRLLSEIQMALHQHAVNNSRERAGLRTVNSMWIWGGGMAPEISTQPMLPLYTDDPLFKGCWLSRSASVKPWGSSFAACIETAEQGFVAITPEGHLPGEPATPDHYLQQLQALLRNRKLNRLSLFFRDGLQVEIATSDAKRFWRRKSPLLEPL